MPKLEGEIANGIGELVFKIQSDNSADTKDLETQIDQLVYKPRSRGRIVREHKNDRAQSNPNTKENPKWTVAHLSETSSWVKEYH